MWHNYCLHCVLLGSSNTFWWTKDKKNDNDKKKQQAGAELQSWKKGCSTAAMLPEGNRQDHFWQKDFGQLYNICHIFD